LVNQGRILNEQAKGYYLMPKIFESPDGGKTVYSREFGEQEREMFWADPEESRVKTRLQESKEWLNILNASKDNSVLQEAVDRVKIIYHLSKNNGQK
jgi:hypothetical protein